MTRRISRGPLSKAPCRMIAHATLNVGTQGPGFIDITRDVAAFLTECGARDGLLTAFVRHTSASLTIQENASPAVQTDLLTALDRLAPRDGGWTHDDEGPDDMPAHIRTMLTGVSVSVPVADGRMVLGTWQAIDLIEHRDDPHRREVVLQFLGTEF